VVLVPRTSRCPIELRAEERAELERRVRTPTLPFRHVQRARLILCETLSARRPRARPRRRRRRVAGDVAGRVVGAVLGGRVRGADRAAGATAVTTMNVVLFPTGVLRSAVDVTPPGWQRPGREPLGIGLKTRDPVNAGAPIRNSA
jgi:hypothetical protein